MKRHSPSLLVRLYAHLSPSYLQEAVEKVSAFGKAETKEQGKQEAERVEAMETTEAPEVLSPVPTGSETGKSCGGIEGL